jgi:hypothetical protein
MNGRAGWWKQDARTDRRTHRQRGCRQADRKAGGHTGMIISETVTCISFIRVTVRPKGFSEKYISLIFS